MVFREAAGGANRPCQQKKEALVRAFPFTIPATITAPLGTKCPGRLHLERR